MKTSIDTTGLDQLQRMLKMMPDRVDKRLIRSGLRKSARPLISAARANVIKRSGNLARSIGSMTGGQRSSLGNISFKQKSALKADKMAIYVGPRAGKSAGKYDGWYGAFVEFGTRHSRKNPFMRPAWDQTKKKVEGIIVENIGAAADKYFKKIKATVR